MYNATKKVNDYHKSIVNRFVVDLYHDKGIKVLLEAKTMMGIRMALNSGDESDYHVVNLKELPPLETPFSLTYHRGALLDVLKSGALPKCHVFYADYCGAPIKTTTPINKDPATEAKLIYNGLLPRGVGIFTFCRRGCKSADTVAEAILLPYFKIAYVHTYNNMMVFIGVKRTASDTVVSQIRFQFQAVLGKYYGRSGQFVSPEERALVMVHQYKNMKCMAVKHPEECEACLSWFNNQRFVVNSSATSSTEATTCICWDCWTDIMPGNSYTINKGYLKWKNATIIPESNLPKYKPKPRKSKSNAPKSKMTPKTYKPKLPKYKPKPKKSKTTPKTYKPKPKKSKSAPQIYKRFPYGIPMAFVKSFNDWFNEACVLDATKLKPSSPGLLMVGDVHKTYKAWCNMNNRAYCTERTSKKWSHAPFVVNNNRLERMPPFRLLMFQKLSRLPERSKDVFSTGETGWRRHKKSYKGFPYYQGLAWKSTFKAQIKYLRVKKSSHIKY